MSAQSAFPFALLAIGVGVALHHLRDVEGAGDAAPPDAVFAAAEGGSRSDVVPIALRRSAGTASPRAGIDVRVVAGRAIRADNLDAAGTRRACRVEPSAHGIEFPDGTRLPLLNGLREAVRIESRSGTACVAPVVAILVDADGWEWYEHADGARTTSRLRAKPVEAGQSARLLPVALHEAVAERPRAMTGGQKKRPGDFER